MSRTKQGYKDFKKAQEKAKKSLKLVDGVYMDPRYQPATWGPYPQGPNIHGEPKRVVIKNKKPIGGTKREEGLGDDEVSFYSYPGSFDPCYDRHWIGEVDERKAILAQICRKLG